MPQKDAAHERRVDFSGVTILERGRRRQHWQDFYYWIQTMGWGSFLLFGCGVFALLSLVFACLYFFTGNQITNARPDSFMDALAFAVQTSSTVGYGYLSPVAPLPQVLSMLQQTISIFFVAGLTGLTIARISRPLAKVTFSQPILWTMLDGKPILSFRLANGRASHISNASLKVVALISFKTKEGLEMRRFEDLSLQRSESPIFAFTWTIIHPIDEASPFFGMKPEDWKVSDIEIFVNFFGYESVLSQTVHSFYRYSSGDMRVGHQFEDIVHMNEDGSRTIDYSKFHATRETRN